VSGRTHPPLASLALELNETYLWHGAAQAMVDVFTTGSPTEHAAREGHGLYGRWVRRPSRVQACPALPPAVRCRPLCSLRSPSWPTVANRVPGTNPKHRRPCPYYRPGPRGVRDRGVYAAENSSKSRQYTGGNFMFLFRVCLGWVLSQRSRPCRVYGLSCL
jgi:hypothetical protein